MTPSRIPVHPQPIYSIQTGARMTASQETPNGRIHQGFHVLIIGAGSVGCLIAQRCKTLGIRCTLFERDHHLNERLQDWNFSVTHARPQLEECLPDHLRSRLSSVLVDPTRDLCEKDVLPILNAQSGELLMNIPTPNAIRLRRSDFRALIAEGLEVKYGKRLSGIQCEEKSTEVSAQFDDGTEATGDLLIGTDGANSRVRDFLFGRAEAAIQPLPLVGCGTVACLPAKVSRQIRDINNNYLVSYHPDGLCAFISLHDVAEPSKPETWKWMIRLTWTDVDRPVPQDPKEIRQEWTERAVKLAEPLRSTYLSVAPSATFWIHRIAEWRTKPWDNHGGRVTLAGDAAHPMTYHRGQGFNNGVLDAAFLCRALGEHARGEKSITEVLTMYEKEVQERGREAVISSGENSLMVHDWKQLKQSPIFTMGLSALKKTKK